MLHPKVKNNYTIEEIFTQNNSGNFSNTSWYKGIEIFNLGSFMVHGGIGYREATKHFALSVIQFIA